MPGRGRALVILSLSLLNVFTVAAGLAVAKLTPERHLSPQPPSVAERDPVRVPASAVVAPAADPASGRAPDPSVLAGRLAPLIGGPKAKISAVVVGSPPGSCAVPAAESYWSEAGILP